MNIFSQTTYPVFMEPSSLKNYPNATILDARTAAEYDMGHLERAISIRWQMFVKEKNSGKLDDDHKKIQTILQTMGISNRHPILIYGNWNKGWGEEARIFWMLTYLGHPQVYIVRGGIQALLQNGRLVTTKLKPEHGDFKIAIQPGERISTASLRDLLSSTTVTILDVRTEDEYHGAMPYGCPRGGHIPGSISFPWHLVFDAQGSLKTDKALLTMFKKLGVLKSSKVVVYCTGGVRSSFIYGVLKHLGFRSVANYDASWWEWSSLPQLPIER